MRDWLSRRWVDLAVLAALVVAVVAVVRWRGEQLQGHGLLGRYYPSSDFQGKPFKSSIDRSIDLPEDDPLFDRTRFSVEWNGSIVLPRDGRYVFATESDDGSWVWIGDDLVVENGGVHGARRKEGVRVLDAGVYSIRIRYFQAGAGGQMRLFWKPGRRGVLEYVSPGLLFPVGPDEVRRERAHPVPPRDFPAAVALGVALLLAVLAWGRRSVLAWIRALRREWGARVDLGVCLLVFVVALALRMWDLSAAGQTWDEDVYWSAGRNFVQNLLSGDLRPESWAWNHEHPALAKWIFGPATLFDETFEPARMVAAILGALTCVVLFLAGRDMVSRRVGAMAAALCIVMPHVVGHHKIIGLETPTALLYALTAWLLFRGVRRGGNSGHYVLAAVTTGLALSTRLSNLSLLLLVLLLYLAVSWREIVREQRFPLPVNLGVFPLVVVAVFVGLWPYLWENPLGHLGQTLSYWKPDIYLERFLGERREPPLYYFPLYFLVTTPVSLLPLVALGLVRTVVKRGVGHITVLLWFLAPWIVIFSPMARDGVRYLIPALVAACLVAAAGADWLASGLARVVRRPSVSAPALGVIAVVAGLQSFRAGLEVHPYYIDYYNDTSPPMAHSTL